MTRKRAPVVDDVGAVSIRPEKPLGPTNPKRPRIGTKGKGPKYVQQNRTTQIRLNDPVVASALDSVPGSSGSTTSGLQVKFLGSDGSRQLVAKEGVERMARKLKKDGYEIYHQKGHVLSPETCYEDVTEDGSPTIIVRPRVGTSGYTQGSDGEEEL